MKIIKNNSGMSLIEILIASAMAVICIVPIIGSYLTVFDWSGTNREETVAIMHLANIMETIKSTPFSSITATFPDNVETLATTAQYAAIVGGDTLVNERITVSYINAFSDPLEVTARVRWKNARGIDQTRYLVTKRAK
ncbi:MAG: hypothetical protein NTY34_06655 [Candidatus Omnitrophica bacterium]|nr:hypothetical protein [Candidatus Omnitrophota bacterium]